MKKTYVLPWLEVTSGEATEMMAVSLPIVDDSVDGGNALTKENDWDIWSDDYAEE